MSKKQKKKSDIDYKGLAIQAITDLIIGIILLILDKIINKVRGAKALLMRQI